MEAPGIKKRYSAWKRSFLLRKRAGRAAGFCFASCVAILLVSRCSLLPSTSDRNSQSQFSLASSSPLLSAPPSQYTCPHYENLPTPFPASFWYVKSFKTGSTTLAGVFRSIAAHYGTYMLNPKTWSMEFAEAIELIKSNYEGQEHLGVASHMPYSLAVAESDSTGEIMGDREIPLTEKEEVSRLFRRTQSSTLSQGRALARPLLVNINTVVQFHPYTTLTSTFPPTLPPHSLEFFKPPFYLFTSVREPVARFHSLYVQKCLYDPAVRRGKTTTECFQMNSKERMMEAHKVQNNEQLVYIGGNPRAANRTVEDVASRYDFIFVQERLDESLAAFAITYNLNFADVISISANVREGKYPKPSEMPAEINDRVRSKTKKDLELWQHANVLLDKRIVEINSRCGGDDARYFETMLATYHRIKTLVEEECSDYKAWYERHGFTSLFTYRNDNGYAPRCRDFVAGQALREKERRGV